MRIVHVSDVHVWRYAFNPFHLLNKRAIGMAELLLRRARKFRLERLIGVIERVKGLEPDHVLITGDLTTTALPEEFRMVRAALKPLFGEPVRVTIVPGNHDRYTAGSVRHRQFERWFGEFAPSPAYPWLRWLDAETAILGLDATRSHISATGRLPTDQLDRAGALLADAPDRPRRLIVACHYPVAAPPPYVSELSHKRMKNAPELRALLETVGPHLYCCGHVHAAWAYVPPEMPNHLSLNAGAPLLRDKTGLRPPGFLEITLHAEDVSVIHHGWYGTRWTARPLYQSPSFFPGPGVTAASA